MHCKIDYVTMEETVKTTSTCYHLKWLTNRQTTLFPCKDTGRGGEIGVVFKSHNGVFLQKHPVCFEKTSKCTLAEKTLVQLFCI